MNEGFVLDWGGPAWAASRHAILTTPHSQDYFGFSSNEGCMDKVMDAYLQGKFKKASRRLARLPLTPEDPRLRARLRRWVFHGDPGLRHASVRILAQLADVPSISLFITRLARYCVDFKDLEIWVEAFRTFGVASTEALSELMRSGDGARRNVAIAMLGHLGGDALPILIEALPDDPPRIARALEGHKDPRVVSALSRCLEESSDREIAQALLECSSPDCSRALPDLARALHKTRDGKVRDQLLEALAKFRDPGAIPVLRRYLSRHPAIRALALIPGREALEALLDALSKKLSGDTLDEVLTSILAHPHARCDERRRAARLALSRFDLWGARLLLAGLPDCQPELERAARSRDPKRRLALARALPRKAAASHYHYAITHGDKRVRLQAARWAQFISLQDAWTLAADPSPGLRRALARGLTSEGPLSVLAHLASDRHYLVRAQVARTLRHGEPAALPILERLAQDKSLVVRQAAQKNSRTGLA